MRFDSIFPIDIPDESVMVKIIFKKLYNRVEISIVNDKEQGISFSCSTELLNDPEALTFINKRIADDWEKRFKTTTK